MKRSYESIFEAERRMREIDTDIRRHLGKLGARATLLEAAMAVIMEHNLLDEFTKKHAEMYSRPIADKIDPQLAANG